MTCEWDIHDELVWIISFVRHMSAHVDYISSHMHTQTVTDTHTRGCHQVGHIVLFVHTWWISSHMRLMCAQYNHLQHPVWPLFHNSCIYSFIHATRKRENMFTSQLKGQVRMTEMILWYITRCRCSSALGLWQICACLVKCSNFHADLFSVLN